MVIRSSPAKRLKLAVTADPRRRDAETRRQPAAHDVDSEVDEALRLGEVEGDQFVIELGSVFVKRAEQTRREIQVTHIKIGLAVIDRARGPQAALDDLIPGSIVEPLRFPQHRIFEAEARAANDDAVRVAFDRSVL